MDVEEEEEEEEPLPIMKISELKKLSEDYIEVRFY